MIISATPEDLRVSIGPRPFGHGNVRQKVLQQTLLPAGGFNWATSFRTWKFRCCNQGHCAIPGRFQLGHVLSDMEMSEIILVSLMLTLGFNWATSFRTWKSDKFNAGEPTSLVSIGPRPFGHGNKEEYH